jgi:hypothetical protein
LVRRRSASSREGRYERINKKVDKWLPEIDVVVTD